MNPQSFSDFNQETSQPENLSETVEKLEVKFQRLQGLVHTLISGLIVAILISIGVSGWFAYRSSLQQQMAEQQAKEFTQTEQELQERLDNLEQRLTRQQKRVKRLDEQLPQKLDTLNSTVDSNEREIEALQEQLNPSKSSQKQNN